MFSHQNTCAILEWTQKNLTLKKIYYKIKNKISMIIL
jgi:hypothetical protein